MQQRREKEQIRVESEKDDQQVSQRDCVLSVCADVCDVLAEIGMCVLTLEAGVFKIIDSLIVDQIDRKCTRRPAIIFTQVTLERNVIEFDRATHEANL